MKLPIGVYVVSEAFRERSGTVTVSFQGQQYEAEMNLNALTSLNELTHMAVQKVEAPFCGYEDITVVIFPAGTAQSGCSDTDGEAPQLSVGSIKRLPVTQSRSPEAEKFLFYFTVYLTGSSSK